MHLSLLLFLAHVCVLCLCCSYYYYALSTKNYAHLYACVCTWKTTTHMCGRGTHVRSVCQLGCSLLFMRCEASIALYVCAAQSCRQEMHNALECHWWWPCIGRRDNCERHIWLARCWYFHEHHLVCIWKKFTVAVRRQSASEATQNHRILWCVPAMKWKCIVFRLQKYFIYEFNKNTIMGGAE